MFERSDSTGAAVPLDTDTACTWIPHPDEEVMRASHALKTDAGVWLIDPLDAPEAEDLIDSLGEVVGVTVLSCWHSRDAGAFARHYDVPVWLPEWMGRVEARVDAPVERYTLAPGETDQGLHTIPCRPFPLWQEVFLYHEPTRTLFTPDSVGATSLMRLDGERLGLLLPRRLQPPTELVELDVDRVLVGHGEPVTDDPVRALETALVDARSTFPNAVATNGAANLRAIVGTLF